MESVRKLLRKRNKIKPGKESDPTSTPRLEEVQLPVLSAGAQSEMWPTETERSTQQPGRFVETFYYQPPRGENQVIDELRRQLQQTHDECARIKSDLRQICDECARVKEDLKQKYNECESVKLQLRQKCDECEQANANLRRKDEEMQGCKRRRQQAERQQRNTKLETGAAHRRMKNDLVDTRHQLDLARKEITKKETELRRLREELDEVRNNKVAPKHNLGEKIDEKIAILDQKLQEATRELGLKDRQMKEALRQKDDKIAQMKHEVNATKQSLQTESEKASKKEHELRQWGDEKDKKATLAISSLTQEIKVLQSEISTRDEQMTNYTKQAEVILQQKEREQHIKLKADFETGYQQLRAQAEADIEALKSENHFLKAGIDDLKTKRDSLETGIDSLRAERDSLQRQYTEAKAVAEDFQYRLSKEFSIRLASDETNMENISVKHRPAKIAEKFAQIESKEWVEAKEVLDRICDDEKTSIRLLVNMLEFACTCAREVFDGFLSTEACRLYSPIAAITKTFLVEQHQNAGGLPPVPGSILKEITAFLKRTCGECDIESLTQSVVDRLKEMHGEDIVPILQDANVQAFLQACCRIAWQMAVQQPPLTVVTFNTRYDEGCHQLWYNSPPPSRSKGVSRGEIDFYIWPELRQAENVLHKGRVCLKPRNLVYL